MEYRSEFGEGAAGSEETSRRGRRWSQTKERLSSAYCRTSETAERLYRDVIDFGRTNPGAAALVALGAGISVGLWLGGGDGYSRYRRRVVPSLATHVAEAVLDLFDARR